MLIKGMAVEMTDDMNGTHRTGSLPHTLMRHTIVAVLGEPNVKDDPYKVENSWGFTIDGERCGIWDYKGSRWSTYGPNEKIKKLFQLT